MIELSCYKHGKGRTPSNFFAVPNEDCANGAVTGTKIFREILEAMESHGERNAVIMWPLLRDMGLALSEKGGKGRSAAAMEISWLMADALLYLAKNSNFKPWLDRKLAEAEKSKVWWDERDAKHKAEFVARMKAGKAAKAAKAVTHGERT